MFNLGGPYTLPLIHALNKGLHEGLDLLDHPVGNAAQLLGNIPEDPISVFQADRA